MPKRGLGKYIRPVLASVLLALAVAPLAFATTSTSNTYKVSETQFGSGAGRGCTDTYCAQTSSGGTSTQSGSSTGNSATLNPVDGAEEQLQLITTPGPSDLGDLTADSTSSSTTQISVSNTQGTGYIVQISGHPPSFDGHTLATSSTPIASVPGIEQFGINLADNSIPDVGKAPVQVPAGTTFGQAAEGYSTPDLFKYVEDDTIAQGVAKAGRTDYTITMIINISNTTPAGKYSGNFAAIVIPVY